MERDEVVEYVKREDEDDAEFDEVGYQKLLYTAVHIVLMLMHSWCDQFSNDNS